MRLVELTEAEAWDLLHRGATGRIAFCTQDGPHILPVNYAVVDATIVIRTLPDSAIARHAPGSRLAFETDQFDVDNERGWSVVAVGPTHRIDHLRELAHVYATWLPHPWANGERDVFLRIDCERLTGRRVSDDWELASLLPLTDPVEPELLGGPIRDDLHPARRRG